MTQQFDEGVKEVLMALFAIGATAYEYNYIKKVLDERPESPKEKIVALQKAQEKIPDEKFDMSAKQVIANLKQQQPILVKPKRQYPQQSSDTQPAPQTPAQPKSSVNVLSFIKEHEKFSKNVYWDYKQYSIGYGTKAQPNEKTITHEEALKRLKDVVAHHENAVKTASEKWGYNWNANQLAALTSFRFNIGSLGGLTANGTRTNEEIAKMIPAYDKADGKPLEGLTKRRKAELELFLRK